jgi:radical SAM protein with 4Fe4S-binding SPASM domain
MEYGFQRIEDEKFPPIVHVETTNVCNLRCIHCPHNDIKKIVPDYEPAYMKMEMWKKIVDEVAQYPSALRLTPDGEPLLKNFKEQVSYALEKGIHIFTFNTHGMYLEGENLEVLLQDTKTSICVEVSLDGFFRDTYENIRLRGDYIRIMRNIFNFVYERDKRKRSNVKIMVSIVQQPEVSDEELKIFNEYWSKVVDKVIIRNYVDTKGLTPTKHIEERVVEDRWPCLVVFTRLVVTYDGRIRFCPDDWQKATTLTSLDEVGSIAELWQSEKFKKLRESHLNRTFEHPTCKQCTDWKVIRWGKDYTAALKDVFSAPKEDKNTGSDSDLVKIKSSKDNLSEYLWSK